MERKKQARSPGEKAESLRAETGRQKETVRAGSTKETTSYNWQWRCSRQKVKPLRTKIG